MKGFVLLSVLGYTLIVNYAFAAKEAEAKNHAVWNQLSSLWKFAAWKPIMFTSEYLA